MPSYYHKGGTHVGVCPISHEYTILNFHYALKTPAGYKQKHAQKIAERATTRLKSAAQAPP